MSADAWQGPPPERLLLIHFGQLGDSVMALPAALALRRHFPQAALTVLASRGGDAIFRMAGFDPVWSADRMRWKHAPWTALVEIPALAWRLRRQRFPLSVDLHSFRETNLLAWIVGIPRRVAMFRATRSIPRLITHLPPPDDPGQRLLDRYCQVLRPLGIEVQPSDRVPRLSPPASARFRVDSLLQVWTQEAGDAPILGFCPGAGHPVRRWPAERFASLARRFQLECPVRLAVFAGPEEAEAVLAPFRDLPRLQIWQGLSVPELAAALALCRVVVSNPTGPSHIAAAVGARVLTLGEVPAFDPVGLRPEDVRALRAPRVVADLELAPVLQALRDLWNAPS